MPLYGQELSDTISPYEAGLGWAVSLTKGEFVGREQMAAVKERGAARRTVGFVTTGRSGAPRTHCEVQVDGRTVGEVTSGTFSPTLQQNIGLALVDRDVAGIGKPLQIIVRGKRWMPCRSRFRSINVVKTTNHRKSAPRRADSAISRKVWTNERTR
jgi:aminomethyltransferase